MRWPDLVTIILKNYKALMVQKQALLIFLFDIQARELERYIIKGPTVEEIIAASRQHRGGSNERLHYRS